jgi:hypothetical protein
MLIGGAIIMIIECPSCLGKFEIADEQPDIKNHLTCPHCQNIFEVTWLYPFTIDFLEETSIQSDRLIESIID